MSKPFMIIPSYLLKHNYCPGKGLALAGHYRSAFARYQNQNQQKLQLHHRNFVVHDTFCDIFTTDTIRKLSTSTVITKSIDRKMSLVQNQATSTSPIATARVEQVETEKVKAVAAADKMDVDNVENVEPNAEKLYFAKLTEHAFAPTKGSKYAAGYDLMSAYDAVVPKRGSCLIKTDIQVQLPHGTYGRVAPRSGLSLKKKIDVGAGVIDEDYRGNIGVILFNHADEDFIVSKGDRIAQLICEKICYAEAVEVKSLEESERGAAGFGSTGGVKKMKMDEKENTSTTTTSTEPEAPTY